MAIGGHLLLDIFHCLHDEYGVDAEDAFDVAVRALRGGGLTKDAVYLRGLIGLLDFLAHDGDFESLYVGKFSLAQQENMEALRNEGWIISARFLPRHLQEDSAQRRLSVAQKIPINELFQREPQR